FVAILYYASVYARIPLPYRLIYGNAVFFMMLMLNFYAKAIGDIDRQSKSISALVYHQLVVKNRCHFAMMKGRLDMVLKYFNATINSFVSIQIFGSPVNMNASIKV